MPKTPDYFHGKTIVITGLVPVIHASPHMSAIR